MRLVRFPLFTAKKGKRSVIRQVKRFFNTKRSKPSDGTVKGLKLNMSIKFGFKRFISRLSPFKTHVHEKRHSMVRTNCKIPMHYCISN